MLYARGDDGVNVVSLATVLTEPATLPPLLLSLKVSVVMLELLMVMLNAAVTTVFVPTPVAPLEGLTLVTFRSVPPPVGVGVGVAAAAMAVLNDASFPVDVPAEVFAAMR